MSRYFYRDASQPLGNPCNTQSATTEYHGRQWLGCELSEAYAELARERIAIGWAPKPVKAAKKKRRLALRQLSMNLTHETKEATK